MTEGERERLPRNWFERILWLHGRRFWLCTVAGLTIFFVGTLAVVVVWSLEAKIEVARLVVEITIAYFAAAVAVVTVFTGGNTATDFFTRGSGTTSTPGPRTSGTVTTSQGEPHG